MDDFQTKALTRVMKARAELIQSRTFYGVLVSQVKPVPSYAFPTMATNGKTHYFNPTFVEKLTQSELLGVQAHESEHDARRHHSRRGARDRKEWNYCTDYAINGDLLKQGFTLPKGALFDPKYDGMSAEDIYRTRAIDRALENMPPPPRQADDDESDDDQEGDDESSDQGGDQGDDQGDQEGDDQESDQDTDESDQGDDQEGDDQGDQEGDQGGNAPAGGDDDQEGENGSPGASQGDSEQDQNGSGNQGGSEDADSNLSESSGDPGQCGEVLDSGEDQAETATEDSRWETIMRQAAMLAARRGEAPGHVARLIETADHPPQDWRETLRAFFDGGADSMETWNRPNRRFIGSGLILPGRQRDGVNRAAFIIDTSGSVTYYPGALEAIKVETQAALDEGIIDELIVIYGDTKVTREDTYRTGDDIEFDPRGGGGTDMKPMFQHIADNIDASLIVCFTDLEIGDPGEEPACPTLWACTGYPATVKHYIANPPWGAPAIEVRPVEEA